MNSIIGLNFGVKIWKCCQLHTLTFYGHLDTTWMSFVSICLTDVNFDLLADQKGKQEQQAKNMATFSTLTSRWEETS